jgi:hypothetical protein
MDVWFRSPRPFMTIPVLSRAKIPRCNERLP